MNLEIHPRAVADFFMDGAKIIFGSLVIGAFVPNINASSARLSWSTILLGIVLTAVFFAVANDAIRKDNTFNMSKSSL